LRHEIEYHRKFTLSFAVFVLFFVGAPLGALIRKGGLGMPVVVAMFFFIFYHIISITGENFAREGVIPPLEGMWAAPFILLPLGIFLTYKANTDSKLLDRTAYIQLLNRLLKRIRKQRKQT
jgi:lipopolysaccharide export system permease protein